MIAANDLPIGPLDDLAPDQLRRLIAVAAGLLADRDSPERATEALRNVARAMDRLCGPLPSPYREKRALAPSTVATATQLAAEMYRVTPDEIHGDRRTTQVTLARQYAMWWLREQRAPDGSRLYSLAAIGAGYGRDHCAALYAWRTVSKRLAKRAAA